MTIFMMMTVKKNNFPKFIKLSYFGTYKIVYNDFQNPLNTIVKFQGI